MLYIFSRFWGSVSGLNASRMLGKVSSLILNLVCSIYNKYIWRDF